HFRFIRAAYVQKFLHQIFCVDKDGEITVRETHRMPCGCWRPMMRSATGLG
uniref:Uncharacterized protein n=1 Tax=Anopheles atroparvus TaxID=41427 RepID=A0AAG5D4E9_ANOAO